jgi:hypothetical protein
MGYNYHQQATYYAHQAIQFSYTGVLLQFKTVTIAESIKALKELEPSTRCHRSPDHPKHMRPTEPHWSCLSPNTKHDNIWSKHMNGFAKLFQKIDGFE